jgi:hypothetical protein
VRGGERLGKRPWRGVQRHQFRRDGIIALGLFLLPWITALILWRSHRHADVVGEIIPVSFGLLAAWLAWAAYRGPKRPGTEVADLSLAQVADRLALAVGKQWADEAAIRRLNDPYPLPVSWAPADASLTDSWDSLIKLASSGAGWPTAPPAGTWAAGPDDLAGQDHELADVLARVPTGRLVVLGEPGAGKTMLMVRLVLDLLARRAEGSPVPFLAPIASWNPAKQGLRDWLVVQLLSYHPALAAQPEGRPEATQAAALLASGLILPLLDGIDEIPEQVRGPAISRINDALQPGERLVLTCRTQQYRDAIRPQDGIEVTMRAAAAIQLRPLGPEAISSYLAADAGGPAMAARWAPVISVLGTAAPVGQVLTTPLMLGLARAIYNPRPGEYARELPDPAMLCSPVMANSTAIASHLLDAYIPAAYRPGTVSRWTAHRAERWLTFLARHLEYTVISPDFAWWRLYQALPLVMFAVLPGLITALAVGLGAGLPFGPKYGLMLGIGSGCFIAGSCAYVTEKEQWQSRLPSQGVRWRHAAAWHGLWAAWCDLKDTNLRSPRPLPRITLYRITMMAIFGVILHTRSARPGHNRLEIFAATGAAVGYGGFAVSMVGIWGLAGGLAGDLGLLIIVGATLMLIMQLEGAPLNLGEAASPRSTLTRDRLMTLALTIAFVLAATLTVGLFLASGTLGNGHKHGLITGLEFGVALGLLLGIAFVTILGLIAVFAVKWPHFELARVCLALQRRVPWSLLSFLDDAHKRGILRQVGAVYEFRHIELQHRLARRDAHKIIS